MTLPIFSWLYFTKVQHNTFIGDAINSIGIEFCINFRKPKAQKLGAFTSSLATSGRHNSAMIVECRSLKIRYKMTQSGIFPL